MFQRSPTDKDCGLHYEEGLRTQNLRKIFRRLFAFELGARSRHLGTSFVLNELLGYMRRGGVSSRHLLANEIARNVVEQSSPSYISAPYFVETSEEFEEIDHRRRKLTPDGSSIIQLLFRDSRKPSLVLRVGMEPAPSLG